MYNKRFYTFGGWFTWFAVGGLAVSAVAETVSIVNQKKASNQQAAVATKDAAYNASIDLEHAKQIDLNADANITAARRDDLSYLSSQRAAYAASGILSGTGSAMQVQATTAGRQEQDIQEYYRQTQEKEDILTSEAKMGVYEGDQQAETFHLQGTTAMFDGIGKIAGNLGGIAAKIKGV